MAKEEDQAKSTAVMKEEDEAWHVIVATMVDKAESTFVAYEDDGTQHVIVAIIAKEVDEARYAVVAQRRTLPIVAKEVNEDGSAAVTYEDEAHHEILAKDEEEKTHA